MKRSLTFILFTLLLVGTLLVGCADSEAPAAPAAEVAQEEPVVPVAEGMRRFVVVPEETTASYIVDEEFFKDALGKFDIPEGRVDTIGTTKEVEGELQLDISDPTAIGPSRFAVNLESLTTDQALRDRWIRNNALESSTYPTAEFVVNAIEDGPANYTLGEEATFKLVGDMTIRDITRPATFDVVATLEDDTARGVASAIMLMSDFGVEPPNFANTLTVADEFEVQIDFVAREP